MQEIQIGIATYKKEDYEEIYSMSTDQDSMDETWEVWEKSKTKAQRDFRKIGISTVDVLVLLVELYRYCRERGLEINGSSRSQFVQWKLQN